MPDTDTHLPGPTLSLGHSTPSSLTPQARTKNLEVETHGADYETHRRSPQHSSSAQDSAGIMRAAAECCGELRVVHIHTTHVSARSVNGP